jgi:pimeloyl-ACP methyl ester carboxylesterase
MGKSVKLAALLLGVLIAVYLVFDYVFPERFAAAAIAAERHAAGLQRKQVDIPGFTMAYLEGGQGKPLVLLHGFGADKDNWTRVSRLLTQHYQVYAPDLPGYGESTQPTPEQSRIEDQLAYVGQFASALGLEHFDLGGNSMGGEIAAAYAAAHPDQVDSLWLLAPAGVGSAAPSDLVKIVKNGGRVPLIAHNPQEYEELLDFVFVDRPFVPHAVLDMFARRAAAKAEFNQKVFARLVTEPPLEQQVQNLATPTLIVWGDHDRALSDTGAEVLRKLMPNSSVIILPDVGHLPMLEVPAQAAADYIAFRGSLVKH